MNEQIFKQRTKRFAIAAVALVEELPTRRSADVIGRQLIHSAASVGANYRSACRGRSTGDLLSRLAIGEEEADESVYWMELLIEAHIVPAVRVNDLMREANKIVAMTVASIKTLRRRK